MAYLLDTNTLIDAQNRYYGMDICPGFWHWLDKAHEQKTVVIVDKIRDEILKKEDELSKWIKARPASIFEPVDSSCMAALGEVSTWVIEQDYKQSAIDAFLRKADYFLIGFAKTHGHTIATHEQHTSGRSKVKIPTVCRALNIPCIDPFQILRENSVKLILDKV